MTKRMIFVRSRAPRRSAPSLTSRNSSPSSVVNSRGADNRGADNRAAAPLDGDRGGNAGAPTGSGVRRADTPIDEAPRALSRGRVGARAAAPEKGEPQRGEKIRRH